MNIDDEYEKLSPAMKEMYNSLNPTLISFWLVSRQENSIVSDDLEYVQSWHTDVLLALDGKNVVFKRVYDNYIYSRVEKSEEAAHKLFNKLKKL